MARPAISTIASTGEGWDGFVDGNFKVIAGIGQASAGGMPLVRFASVGALPASAISEDCIAFVQADGVYEHPGTVGPWRRVGGVDHATTEKQVGSTDDGNETLYEKLVQTSGNLGTGSQNIAHGISNLDRVVEAEVWALRDNGAKVPFPFTSATAGFIVSLQVDATNIVLNVGASWTGAGNTLSDVWALLRYTKT